LGWVRLGVKWSSLSISELWDKEFWSPNQNTTNIVKVEGPQNSESLNSAMDKLEWLG